MKQPLLAGAITTTTLAITAATPAPIIGHDLEILILATAASVVLWLDLRMVILAERIQNGVGETRAEVHEYKQHTDLAKLLRDAGHPIDGELLTLPTPQGPIRPIATEIEGDTILVGIDASTHLADVIDLRHALADRDNQAAQ